MSTTFSPGYEQQIEQLVALIPQWIALQDDPPALQWHRPGDTAFIGPLHGKALDYLAASPDARRLLEWLDDKTGGVCTLLQASAALGLLGKQSPDHRLPPSPCGHCGKVNDAATAVGGDDNRPEPGDVALCAYCYRVNRYTPEMGLEAVADADLDAWIGTGNARRVREMQATARSAVLRKPGTKRGAT